MNSPSLNFIKFVKETFLKTERETVFNDVHMFPQRMKADMFRRRKHYILISLQWGKALRKSTKVNSVDLPDKRLKRNLLWEAKTFCLCNNWVGDGCLGKFMVSFYL